MQVRVKPTVHDDGRRIFIELNVENSQVLPDAGRYPTIATTRTKNKVLLRSGETVLIGGLLSSRTDLDRHGIPWLSSIPGIGWLFRGWRREKQRTQLLVMVTASTPHQ